MSTLLFSSMTITQKAKRILLGIGIHAQMKKLDSVQTNGCTYGLSFPEKFYLDAIAELRRVGIPYTLGT